MSDVTVARIIAALFGVLGLVGFAIGITQPDSNLLAVFGAAMVIIGIYFGLAAWQVGKERAGGPED